MPGRVASRSEDIKGMKMATSKRVLGGTRRYGTLTLAIAMALATPVAWAQDTQEAPKDKPKTDEPATLETVTVTAERREENIQKVPVSISTMNAATLRALGEAGDDVRALS